MATQTIATPTRATQWAPARAYRDALAAHEAAQAAGAAVDELEAMTDAVITARDAMLSKAAPNHIALLEKLRFFFEADADHRSQAGITMLLCDAERLLAPEKDCAELRARDREGLILSYLGTLLGNMGEDLQTATLPLRKGTTQAHAAADAFNGLSMAEEYVKELRTLADRPIPIA